MPCAYALLRAPVRRLPYWHTETEMHGSTMLDVGAAVSEEPIPLDYGPWLAISPAGRALVSALLTVNHVAAAPLLR